MARVPVWVAVTRLEPERRSGSRGKAARTARPGSPSSTCSSLASLASCWTVDCVKESLEGARRAQPVSLCALRALRPVPVARSLGSPLALVTTQGLLTGPGPLSARLSWARTTSSFDQRGASLSPFPSPPAEALPRMKPVSQSSLFFEVRASLQRRARQTADEAQTGPYDGSTRSSRRSRRLRRRLASAGCRRGGGRWETVSSGR